MACRASFFSSYHFLRFEGNFPKDPRRVEDLERLTEPAGRVREKGVSARPALLASFGGLTGLHGGDGRMVFGLRDRVLKVCVVEIRVSG